MSEPAPYPEEKDRPSRLAEHSCPSPSVPLIAPLGDTGLLVRFGATSSDAANRAAIAFARRLEKASLPGVEEIVPNLVSVLLRYDQRRTSFSALAGEVRLLHSVAADPVEFSGSAFEIDVVFGNSAGPDLAEVAAALDLSPERFIEMHNAAPLRVIATGFAPGFVYCGFHGEALRIPRRNSVRTRVPAGSVMFAAGQTAIAATPIPTGWHLIGHTDFSNFDPAAEPPTRLSAGDRVTFRQRFA